MHFGWTVPALTYAYASTEQFVVEYECRDDKAIMNTQFLKFSAGIIVGSLAAFDDRRRVCSAVSRSAPSLL